MILLYNSQYKNNNTTEQKLKFWWLSSYKIVKTNTKKKNYIIAELNSTEKSKTVLRSRLKSYLKQHATVTEDFQQQVETHL